MNVETIKNEIAQLHNEAVELTKKQNLTTADKAQFELKMSKVEQLRAQLKSMQTTDAQRLEKVREVAGSIGSEERTAVQRVIDAKLGLEERKKLATEELRSYLNGETRTYSQLTTTNPGALIPVEFEYQLILTEMAAGPLVAGSPACSEIKTPTGGPRKMPISDDLSNLGFVHSESTPAVNDGEITPGQLSLGVSTFDSGIVVMSRELAEDADWIVGQQVMQKALGARLGRIQNKTFLASLLTQLAANSSSSVAAGGSTAAYSDITNLVGSVNAQYRYSDKAGFLMNSSTQKALAGLTGNGLPIFKNILAQKPELMGYPVYVSDFADSIASGKNPIVFGDWSYVFIRHIPGTELLVLRQRFAELGQIGFIGRKRADLQYAVPSTADSAIKVLHFA
jgi:HK97 family phage major capsid protein